MGVPVCHEPVEWSNAPLASVPRRRAPGRSLVLSPFSILEKVFKYTWSKSESSDSLTNGGPCTGEQVIL